MVHLPNTICPQARQRTDADMPLPVQCTAGGTCSLHLVRRPHLSLASVYRLPLNFPEYSDHCPLPRLSWATTWSRRSGLCSPRWTPGCGRRGWEARERGTARSARKWCPAGGGGATPSPELTTCSMSARITPGLKATLNKQYNILDV